MDTLALVVALATVPFGLFGIAAILLVIYAGARIQDEWEKSNDWNGGDC